MGSVALSIVAIFLSGAGTAPELVVEAFVAEADDPLLVSYAVATGDQPDGSGVSLSFTSDSSEPMASVQLAPGHGGVFLATVRYPASALWTVTVAVNGAEVVFNENLPWPHYTTEAGHPKVKYDSNDPGRSGVLVAPEDSIYLAAVAEPSNPVGWWPIGFGALVLGLVVFGWLRQRDKRLQKTDPVQASGE